MIKRTKPNPNYCANAWRGGGRGEFQYTGVAVDEDEAPFSVANPEDVEAPP